MAFAIEWNERTFGPLWQYIINDNITDMKWNGRQLWIDDLTKGRYLSDVTLSQEFLNIFTENVKNYANVYFNASQPSLQAEIDSLRIHAIHPSRSGVNQYILAIRKTPAIARLNHQNIIKQGYADVLTRDLIEALMKIQCSGIVIGDVGSGKTEFIKYIVSFIDDNVSLMSVEDTLEMKLPILYPQKDISQVKIDAKYTAEIAIRDALRLMVKYLLISEARGREISRIIEGASTGCVAWTSIHAENVWEIPDRVVQMAGKDDGGQSYENDVYSFFDVGIKIKKSIHDDGIHRRIDQICFFERSYKNNEITLIMEKGKFLQKSLPKLLQMRLKDAGLDDFIKRYNQKLGIKGECYEE